MSNDISNIDLNNQDSTSSLEMDLLIQANQRKEGLKKIREFTNGVSDLIVIDPYIYCVKASDSATYIEEFTRCARIHKLKKLHIVYSSKHDNTTVIKNGIKNKAREANCSFSETDTDAIHDRIWIGDRKKGIVIGTSLGGLGRRIAFILDLPKEDFDAILKYLDAEGLSRASS